MPLVIKEQVSTESTIGAHLGSIPVSRFFGIAGSSNHAPPLRGLMFQPDFHLTAELEAIGIVSNEVSGFF
jgi:hypothetical protein